MNKYFENSTILKFLRIAGAGGFVLGVYQKLTVMWVLGLVVMIVANLIIIVNRVKASKIKD